MRRDMSKAVTWINPIINTACVCYGFHHLNIRLQSVVSVFCEFFNFTYNFARLHHWATAYMYLQCICAANGDTILAGYTVLSGLVFCYFHGLLKLDISYLIGFFYNSTVPANFICNVILDL